MTGARDENHVQIFFFDHPVQVHPGEALAGVRPPMSQETFLDVLEFERLFQERVVL